MTSSKRRSIPAIVAAVLAMGTGYAWAAEPSVQDVQAQIQALQSQLEDLKVQQQAQAAAADVDATVERMVSEADRRSQMMQVEGFTAGWNKGKFVLQSADGNYVLNPGIQFQFRYVANMTEDAVDDDDDTIETGFEVRRAKISFEGNAISKDLTYKFQWNTAGGTLVLEDAYINYALNDSMTLQLGQFKDPIFHEEIIGSKRQLAVDFSLLNEVLGGGVSDRIQGVGLTWKPTEQFSLQGVLHDGINSDNTNFIDGGGALNVAAPDFGVAVRAEYLVFGDKKAYNDFSAIGNKEDLLVIGAGADWTQAGDNDVILHTVDVQYETGKLALYGAYLGAYRTLGDDIAGEDSFYDFGVLGQVGYLLNDKWEVFGRYDILILDDDALAADDEDTLHEITLGVNYFISGHNAKVTVDGTYLPNGAPGITGLGFIGSDEDEFVLRGQFQLLL